MTFSADWPEFDRLDESRQSPRPGEQRGGTVRPSALVVLRLITSCTWSASATVDRPASRLQNAVNVTGRAAVLFDEIGSIGDQAASSNVLWEVTNFLFVDATGTGSLFGICCTPRC